MRWGLALLRWLVGGLFMAHGAQKLFGAFGGHGLEGTGQFFEQHLEMAPGKRNALAAGVSELGGGAALAAGVATPLAATALTGTMTTAIWKVHKDKGFFTSNGGWEFNAVLIAATAAIVDAGPGPLALGRREGHGALVTLAAIGAGVAGGFGAMELARREHAKRQEAKQPGGGQGSGAGPGPGESAGEPAATSA